MLVNEISFPYMASVSPELELYAIQAVTMADESEKEQRRVDCPSCKMPFLYANPGNIYGL